MCIFRFTALITFFLFYSYVSTFVSSLQDVQVNLISVISVWYDLLVFLLCNTSYFKTPSELAEMVDLPTVSVLRSADLTLKVNIVISVLQIKSRCTEATCPRSPNMVVVQLGMILQLLVFIVPSFRNALPGLTHRQLTAAHSSKMWKCIYQLCSSKENLHNVMIDLSHYLYLRVANSLFFNCFI